MRKMKWVALVSLVSAGIAMPASAGKWQTVPLGVRDPNKPLPVAVHLAQNELRIGVDPSTGPTPNMYGLIGALMIDAMASGQSKKSRAEVELLLRELGEFDGSAPLMAGVQAGLSNVPWLSLLTPRSLRDNSTEAKNALLDNASGAYLVDVDCSYNVGQSFEAIFSRCTIQVADKRAVGGSPDARWKLGKLLMDRAVQTEIRLDMSTSATPLPHCLGEERREICRTKWAENSAFMMRKALTSGLEKLGSLVGRAIALSAAEADITSQPKTRRVLLSGLHSGPVFEGGDNIVDAGRTEGFWTGAKAAILKANSDGTMIVEAGGNLYHKRDITAP